MKTPDADVSIAENSPRTASVASGFGSHVSCCGGPPVRNKTRQRLARPKVGNLVDSERPLVRRPRVWLLLAPRVRSDADAPHERNQGVAASPAIDARH